MKTEGAVIGLDVTTVVEVEIVVVSKFVELVVFDVSVSTFLTNRPHSVEAAQSINNTIIVEMRQLAFK